MKTDDERREFFRIRDRIPLELRVITHEEFISLESTVRYNSAPAMDHSHELGWLEEHRETRDEGDYLLSYMQMINKKLDMIIDILGKPAEAEKRVTLHTDVNLSGSGIQFESTVPFEQGQLVELKIVIPVYPYPKMTCLCEVMRIEKDPGGDPPALHVSLKFLVINEKDQDVLINYIFLKERQYLRKQKETPS